MLRQVLSRRSSRLLRGMSLAPVVFGCAVWLAFPAVAARADLAALLAGLDRGGESWRLVLTASPAGSTHQSELVFGDERVAEAVGGNAGLQLPDGEKIAFRDPEAKQDATEDEDRVTRKLKKGRIVAVVPMLPPKDFSAGSVLKRTSSLLAPVTGLSGMLAMDTTTGGKAQAAEVATAFYRKTPDADAGVPAMLAGLITNHKADVLATAYAPAGPDYSAPSPFDSILAKKDDAGRFVPEIGPKDHAWAANILPPSVFTAEEQQCLASGIYFEARGESVKGQAAVAQVILNRVRNPAYPKTICGVVYQNEDWRNRCQFSFACDNIRDRVNSKQHWKIAREVALAVTAGKIWLPEVGSATHYHAIYVRPNWARTMVKVGRIGWHIFYRTYGGGWI